MMRILEGFKVVDVTAWAFVPAAGGVLAHWGADVIKVESPNGPDPMRTLGGTLEPGGAAPMFKHYSRGKRSIAIDLSTEQGRELVYKLVADADVFLTSYLAPTRRKLGIDVEDIRRINPRIIYARGSGHGPKGPDADRPGFDGLSWWYRGSLGQTCMDLNGLDWPANMVGHGDGMSGMTLAGGICAALLHRERTGKSVVVDASLLGTAVWFNGNNLIPAQFNPIQRDHKPAKRPPPPPGAPPGLISAVRTVYQTRDYRFINLLFLTDDDRDFADLAQRIGREELAADPRFQHRTERQANSDALFDILVEEFAARDFAEWKALLATARGAWAPIQTPEEVFDDPQTIANGFIRNVDDSTGKGLMVPVPPVLFDEEAGDPPRAPEFAEHTDEILGELGFDAAAIRTYREAGTVA
jgi:crotonobetainyl-CoA:carnitine CoA-transferase CaiB-like acyl-CoA transferase